jgi:hypothetical protein
MIAREPLLELVRHADRTANRFLDPVRRFV